VALALLVLFHRRSREGGKGEPRDPEPSAAALS
jgi:hypothetical protein